MYQQATSQKGSPNVENCARCNEPTADEDIIEVFIDETASLEGWIAYAFADSTWIAVCGPCVTTRERELVKLYERAMART